MSKGLKSVSKCLKSVSKCLKGQNKKKDIKRKKKSWSWYVVITKGVGAKRQHQPNCGASEA